MPVKKVPGLYFASEDSRRLGLLMDAAAREEFLRKCTDEDDLKLKQLCAAYRIEDGPFMFYFLALALARERYPEPKSRGRRSKWTAMNGGALVVEIERLIVPGDSQHSVSWACGVLAKREPWKSFLEAKDGTDTFGADPAEALRQAYSRHRRWRWTNISRDAFKWHERTSSLDEWDTRVSESLRHPDISPGIPD
jgi:hypothetical protein